MLAMLLLGAAPPTGHQHDFDFEFGRWRADVNILQHPFSGSHTYSDLRGTSVVHKIWGGRANYGVLEIGNATTHIEGLTLRIFDPRSSTWNVYFSENGSPLSAPTVGGFHNGRGEFYDTERLDGRITRVRFVFSDLTPTSFRFEQSFSRDAWRTWELEWKATFTK